MTQGVTITPAGPDRIDELTDFWLLLHAFQGAASVPIPGVPLREDSDTGPLVRAEYLEWLSQPDSFAFFAEEGGRPVGFIIGIVQEPSDVWDTGRIGHIDSFLVLPEMRGRGVGRLLMDAVYDHLRRVGVKTVGLDTVATNHVALRFYEHGASRRLSFTCIGLFLMCPALEGRRGRCGPDQGNLGRNVIAVRSRALTEARAALLQLGGERLVWGS